MLHDKLMVELLQGFLVATDPKYLPLTVEHCWHEFHKIKHLKLEFHTIKHLTDITYA